MLINASPVGDIGHLGEDEFDDGGVSGGTIMVERNSNKATE